MTETDIAFQNGMLCGMAQKGFLTQNIHTKGEESGGGMQLCKFKLLPSAGIIREFKKVIMTGNVEVVKFDRVHVTEVTREFGKIKISENVEILLVEEI